MASDDYDDGVAAGKILERLDHHDRHFLEINGSIDRVAEHIAELSMHVQRLADQAVAAAATVLTTAAALKDAEEARRDSGEQKWSPISRTITIILAVVAVAGVVITILSTR